MATATINKSRFIVASGELSEISKILEKKGFEELDPCVCKPEQGMQILIDSEKKTFYYLDDECLTEATQIIAHKFNEDVWNTNLKGIIEWEF